MIVNEPSTTVKIIARGFARMTPAPPPPALPRRLRTLAMELVEVLGQRIREGQLAAGDKLPTEAAFMAEFGVSRTVVREAISKLQASGLVETRHGIGSFIRPRSEAGGHFRIEREHLDTLHDVIALLELRIGLETEAAGLAAQRRSEANLAAMGSALHTFSEASAAAQDAVASDFAFHLEIARATQNRHFAALMLDLGDALIPRARHFGTEALTDARRDCLRRVNSEHESILDAIAAGDADAARAAMRTHLANSRERRRRTRALAPGR
jgi:DNA-binding FadR family transcriptional regulator